MFNNDKIIKPRPIASRSLPYRLGLPAWAFSGWKNKYFDEKPSSLSSYSSVFNMVEGNTTFYQIPDESQVHKWQQDLLERDFKISFKLPSTITHSARPKWQDLDIFLNRIAPLQNHLGPLLLVFPARIGVQDTDFIRSILDKIPPNFTHVVEVRNQGFFGNPKGNNALRSILQDYQSHRVILDSRPLYCGDQTHPDVVQAKHEKPNVPVSPAVINKMVFVRLVMHPASSQNSGFLKEWAKTVAKYLTKNIEVYFTLHCPNNLFCPMYAREFHEYVQHELNGEIADLPAFPVPQQNALF